MATFRRYRQSAQAAAEHAEKQRISNQALSELNNNLIDHRRKLAALVDKHSSLELPIRNLTADQVAVPAKKLNDMSVAVEPEKQASSQRITLFDILTGNGSSPPTVDERLLFALSKNRCYRPEIDGFWPAGRDVALKRWSEESGRNMPAYRLPNSSRT
jgi:hypothetical protein